MIIMDIIYLNLYFNDYNDKIENITFNILSLVYF